MMLSLLKTLTLTLAILIATLPSPLVYGGETAGYRIYVENEVKLAFTGSGVSSNGEPAAFSYSFKYRQVFDVKIINKTITGYNYVECLGLSIGYNTSTVTSYTSMSPGEYFCTSQNQTITENLETYIRSSVNNLISYGERTMSNYVESGYLEYTYEVSYEGLDYYKGLPVNKFKINLHVKASEKYSGEVTGSGETYIYVGLPIPLYSRLDLNGELRSESGNLTITATLEYRNVKNNLESTAKHAAIDLDSAVLIIGGPKESNIRLIGHKGSNKLTIINTGTMPGYLTILYRRGKMTLQSGVDEKTPYQIYVVGPGENRTVELKFALDRDVDVEASIGMDIGGLVVSLLPLIILVIIAVPLILLIHRHLSRASKSGESITVGEIGGETGGSSETSPESSGGSVS